MFRDNKRNGKKSGGPRRPAPGRRLPPREATGEEERYLGKVKTAGAFLVVHLANGEEHRGRVEYFDRQMIKLARMNGPDIFIRKSDIRYLHEQRD